MTTVKNIFTTPARIKCSKSTIEAIELSVKYVYVKYVNDVILLSFLLTPNIF